MKKFILLLLGASSIAFADNDYEGVIESIDNANKTIIVSGSTIKIMPYTEIEQDSCGIWDTHKAFSELKVGDIVEIDVFYDNGQMIAKEIEIACWKAY